jgi:hypothetical protein
MVQRPADVLRKSIRDHFLFKGSCRDTACRVSTSIILPYKRNIHFNGRRSPHRRFAAIRDENK